MIDEGLLRRAKALCENREQQQREAEAIVKVREKLVPLRKDQTIPILRGWIAKNGPRLEGHPDYEALSTEEKKQVEPLGRYTPEAVRLPVATVKTVLGEVPKGFVDKWVSKERGVQVLAAQLASYPALLQWCKDNAHRIKEHPRYQERTRLEPLGSYEAETIALPQREFERILGFVPENIKQRSLVLGEEGRRRLYVYIIAEGTSF